MIKIGDLVHVPENVLLFDPHARARDQFDYIYTLSPQVAMVLGEPRFFSDVESPSFPNKYCKIFCMGRVYNVSRESVFPLKKGE